MAILRIDDIQAYSLEDVSIKMIEEAKSRGIPVSLGVIPKGIDQDTPINRYLKKNSCWLEIAQHGFDHQGITPGTPEFAGVDEATARTEIGQGNAILEKIAKEKIVTFIPPENAMSEGARKAIVASGIGIISSEGNRQFDYGASTYNYLTDELNSVDTIMSDCARSIARRSICVVMMHPQDFVTGTTLVEAKYATYIDTLNHLEAAGYTFVRFKDFLPRK